MEVTECDFGNRWTGETSSIYEKSPTMNPSEHINQNKEFFPVYSLRAAAQMIYWNISATLRGKYGIEIIYRILELMDDFFDEEGINIYTGQELPISNIPPEVDENDMHAYIKTQLAGSSLRIEDNELTEILQEELRYCESIGAVGDSEKHPKTDNSSCQLPIINRQL